MGDKTYQEALTAIQSSPPQYAYWQPWPESQYIAMNGDQVWVYGRSGIKDGPYIPTEAEQEEPLWGYDGDVPPR